MSRATREQREREALWSDGGWSGPQRRAQPKGQVLHATVGGKGRVAQLAATDARRKRRRETRA